MASDNVGTAWVSAAASAQQMRSGHHGERQCRYGVGVGGGECAMGDKMWYGYTYERVECPFITQQLHTCSVSTAIGKTVPSRLNSSNVFKCRPPGEQVILRDETKAVNRRDCHRMP